MIIFLSKIKLQLNLTIESFVQAAGCDDIFTEKSCIFLFQVTGCKEVAFRQVSLREWLFFLMGFFCLRIPFFGKASCKFGHTEICVLYVLFFIVAGWLVGFHFGTSPLWNHRLFVSCFCIPILQTEILENDLNSSFLHDEVHLRKECLYLRNECLVSNC